MKKFLPVILTISLVFGLMPLLSCACSEETLKLLPYGEVIDWYPRLDVSTLPKDDRNTHVDYEKAEEISVAGGTLYLPIDLVVKVRNTGEDGAVVFHAECKVDTGRNNQDEATNISLAKDQEGEVYFKFYVSTKAIPIVIREGQYIAIDDFDKDSLFIIEAVNLKDVVQAT